MLNSLLRRSRTAAAAQTDASPDSASTGDLGTPQFWDPFDTMSPVETVVPSSPEAEAPRAPVVERPSATRHGSEFVDSCRFLLGLAGEEHWPVTTAERKHLLRKVRSLAHPDRRNGDRALWNQVESAVRMTSLVKG